MSIHAKLSPEAAKRLQVQRRRSQVLSIVIACLSLILVAGVLSIFALQVMVKEPPVIVTYSVSMDEEKEVQKKKMPQKVQRKPSSPAPNNTKVIAAAISAPMAIPVPDVSMPEQSIDFGADGDFGQGWSEGTKGTTGGLFGLQVTSSNLGVVLDVSGSAHKHLDKTIAEIDKNFPTAHMVLVVGCGMSDGKGAFAGGGGKVPGKPRVVAYRDIESEKQYNSLKRSVPGQLEDFFKKTGEKRSKELRRYFEKRENLYVLYGGDILAANFAFDYVMERNVDTIYWFADFADNINGNTVDDLGKRLQRNGIKVIAHNFLGKPVAPKVKEMAEKTGGQTIEIIPGK